MSQREKRLVKKLRNLSLLEVNKNNAENCIKQLEEELEQVKLYINSIVNKENDLEEYVNKKEDSNVFMAQHRLVDGTELDVLVVKEDRTVIVSALGLVGKAKAHEDEDFIFEIGYQLALNRLIEQYLNLLLEMNNEEILE